MSIRDCHYSASLSSEGYHTAYPLLEEHAVLDCSGVWTLCVIITPFRLSKGMVPGLYVCDH